jgi:hypothetical protein
MGMEIESIIINAGITIFSLGLLAISLASYKKYKNMKLLFIGIVFLVFLVKGILLSLEIFYSEIISISSSTYWGLFDLIILILLFIATLKR